MKSRKAESSHIKAEEQKDLLIRKKMFVPTITTKPLTTKSKFKPLGDVVTVYGFIVC